MTSNDYEYMSLGCRPSKRRRIIEDEEDSMDLASNPSHPWAPNANAADASMDYPACQQATPEDGCDGGSDDEPIGNEQAHCTTPQRLILLTVKTGGSTHVNFPLSEEIINEIPEYAAKLEKARYQIPRGQRIRIQDNKFRKEEVMLQAIDYLSSGILEPIEIGDERQTLEGLKELTALYELGSALGIIKLEEAIVDHISNHDLDPMTLVRFASYAYPKVGVDSSLGLVIYGNLLQKLAEILNSEAYAYVQQEGDGLLKGQLMDVMADQFRGQGQKAREEMIVIKDEDESEQT